MSMYGGNRLNRGPIGSAPPDPALLVNAFDYGAPAGAGGTDGGGTVAFQLTFQGASGALVDEVSGITLTSSYHTPATPVYQVPFGKEYSTNHLQGFGFRNPGVGTRFENTSAQATMAIGTGDAVFEMILSWRFQSHVGWHFNCTDGAAPTQGYRFYMNANGAHDTRLQATDGTLVNRVGSVTPVLNDKSFGQGGWGKVRFVIDRTAAMAYFYVNGVLLDSWSIATLAAKSIPCPQVAWGSNWGSTANSVGRYAEVRLTLGTTTANSGGPGNG